jgi:hypothetical protein
VGAPVQFDAARAEVGRVVGAIGPRWNAAVVNVLVLFELAAESFHRDETRAPLPAAGVRERMLLAQNDPDVSSRV